MDLGNGLSNSNNFLTYDDCFTQKSLNMGHIVR